MKSVLLLLLSLGGGGERGEAAGRFIFLAPTTVPGT